MFVYLDSAVVLEVLHSLLGVLGTTDTNVHRQVMKWKYQLITAQKRSDDSNNLKYSRKVIENGKDCHSLFALNSIIIIQENLSKAATLKKTKKCFSRPIIA